MSDLTPQICVEPLRFVLEELSKNNSSALSENDKHECACAGCALFTDRALVSSIHKIDVFGL